ncbi:hypothetical protein RM572_27105 [Streptomyces sp. DSM 42041]|uniref:Uncharacterized protein n=1 Tax=Streptomyces hazeniae TaxID=3075538 RepID=A0ABU2P102_9ACTN|nr:hypothetical protein [Streptomyces sp. DSM 42041]MDT0382432.1 hypothetical protein [Streptomyces sp. DSM 42041]
MSEVLGDTDRDECLAGAGRGDDGRAWHPGKRFDAGPASLLLVSVKPLYTVDPFTVSSGPLRHVPSFL